MKRKMEAVECTALYTIYAHRETGVMYFCPITSDGCAVCVMVDAEGKPLIYKEKTDV